MAVWSGVRSAVVTVHTITKCPISIKKQRDERMDFLVRRADGTGVRLHPQKTKRTIDAYDEHPHPQPVPTPRRGVGRSDGRGTFKRYKELGVTRTLRFKEAQVSR